MVDETAVEDELISDFAGGLVGVGFLVTLFVFQRNAYQEYGVLVPISAGMLMLCVAWGIDLVRASVVPETL